jgi:hypothetical protein
MYCYRIDICCLLRNMKHEWKAQYDKIWKVHFRQCWKGLEQVKNRWWVPLNSPIFFWGGGRGAAPAYGRSDDEAGESRGDGAVLATAGAEARLQGLHQVLQGRHVTSPPSPPHNNRLPLNLVSRQGHTIRTALKWYDLTGLGWEMVRQLFIFL